MTHSFSSRMPSIVFHVLTWAGFVVLPFANFFSLSVSAETAGVAIGDQVKTHRDIATLPDGQHQLCSEPEPSDFLQGSGFCYWFRKQGNQFTGYYGRPHSSDFIDCVKGTIQDEKIVGNALTMNWDGAPWPIMEKGKAYTWEDLTLESGKIEYQKQHKAGLVQVIKFDQAVLSLNNFYRYSAAKVAQMKPPPRSCNVNEWVAQFTD